MSSDFKHGKEIVVDNETYYRMNYDNNKIYKTNSDGIINISNEGKVLNEKPLDFSITKNIATILLVSILMFFSICIIGKVVQY
jgi:F-type H+-transporting ATPase subunit a